MWIGQHEGPGKPLILETLSKTKKDCQRLLNKGPYWGAMAVPIKVKRK